MHSLRFYRQPDSASLVLFRSLRTRGALLFGQRRHPLCYACHIRSVHTRADWATVSKIYEYMEEQRGFIENHVITLMETELTTAFLRDLWDWFRVPRTINRKNDYTLKELKNGKWFLCLDERRPILLQ